MRFIDLQLAARAGGRVPEFVIVNGSLITHQFFSSPFSFLLLILVRSAGLVRMDSLVLLAGVFSVTRASSF